MKNLDKGFHESPNIQSDSETYEILNKACNPEDKIERFFKLPFSKKAIPSKKARSRANPLLL